MSFELTAVWGEGSGDVAVPPEESRFPGSTPERGRAIGPS